MRAVAYLLLDPMLHFAIVLLIGLVLWLVRWRKWAIYVFLYAGIWFFIMAVSPVSWWLVSGLENAYTPFEPETTDSVFANQESHIVILGGGYTYSPFLPANNQLSSLSLGRLVEGIRLHKAIPGSKIVCSGSSGIEGFSQAFMSAQTAVSMGVAPNDTLMMETPRFTEEEARDYAHRFGNRHPVILVTDAAHMPRAMFWFEQHGLHPRPAPTNHYIKPDPGRYDFPLKPTYRKIGILDKVLHEYAGLLYAYWKTGKWAVE